MPSFSIALTGLQADSAALNTIGNNLANLNTTAFKKQRTTFEDLFYQQIGNTGAGEAVQTGAGVKVSGTASSFLQGSLSTTSDAADMALNGDGFFVVQRGQNQLLTRAGDFQVDRSGNLITSDGASVMGFAAVNGAVTTTGNLTPLTLPLEGNGAAKATTAFALTGNLDATAATGASFSTSVTMYDSLGTSQVVTVNFTKTAPNQWGYAMSLPSGQATGTPLNTTGTLTFDSTGALTSPTANKTGISFPGLADGAADLNFDWTLFGAGNVPTIAQSAGSSTAKASSQNGYSAGTYEGFTVDAQGTISASFTNGRTAAIGQLAIASVANAGGLTRVGGNNYQTSAASGTASFAGAGVGSRGTIEDDALEQSNVDISTEFSDLIVAQRAFEANSKTVTAFDTVTQQAINMVR